MLGTIALVYILLCLRIRVQLEASWENTRGSASFCVGALGIYLRCDFEIVLQAFSIRAMPRYGKTKRKKAAGRGRIIRTWLMDALRSRQFESIALQLRFGFGDAGETALTAGVLQALVSTAFAASGDRRLCELQITPDFAKPCLCAHLQGIFAWQVGDIMLAALKQARRKRKEGLKWTSIPLKA